MTDFTEQELKSLASEPPSNKAEDPTGQFPLDGYINKPNTNVQAIGRKK